MHTYSCISNKSYVMKGIINQGTNNELVMPLIMKKYSYSFTTRAPILRCWSPMNMARLWEILIFIQDSVIKLGSRFMMVEPGTTCCDWVHYVKTVKFWHLTKRANDYVSNVWWNLRTYKYIIGKGLTYICTVRITLKTKNRSYFSKDIQNKSISIELGP